MRNPKGLIKRKLGSRRVIQVKFCHRSLQLLPSRIGKAFGDFVELVRLFKYILGAGFNLRRRLHQTPSKGPYVYVVDPHSEGHHPVYQLKIGTTFQELKQNVRYLAESKANFADGVSQVFDEHVKISETLPARNFQFRLNRLNELYGDLKYWIELCESLTRDLVQLNSAPNLIFLCWLDSYLSKLPISLIVRWLIPINWTGIYFHPRSFRRPNEHPKLKPLSSKYCKGIFILDEGIAKSLELTLEIPVMILPDFTDLSEPISLTDVPIYLKIKQLARGRKVVGMLGSLEQRKGLIQLLDAIEVDSDAHFFYVIAGYLYRDQFSHQVLANLEALTLKEQDRVLLLTDKRVESELEFNTLLQACDYLYLAYNDFPHSSNLMTKAAAFRKPILVRAGDLMAERVSRFGLGQVVSGPNPVEIHRKLKALEKTTLQSGFSQFAQIHNSENLKVSLTKILSQIT